MDKDNGASSGEDRATAAAQSNPQAVSSKAGIPSADKTALSFWFPKVLAAGLPVPKTAIVEMPEAAHYAVGATLWGEQVDAAPIEAFLTDLRAFAADFGAPFFLRTDHTSGKHYWDTACFVSDLEKLGDHVFAISEFSEICDMFGLPRRNWVVRELLPTMPVGTCPNYGNMPVCKEFRFFVNGPEVECFHPYWPRFALEQGGCDLSDEVFHALCSPDNEDELRGIASLAGQSLGGRWSVDLLETSRGWFLTDMAEAEKSFHWEGCPAQAIEARQGGDGTAPSRSDESAVAEGHAPNPIPDTEKTHDPR